MKKSEKYGMIGSVILTLLLFLMLFLIVMPGLKTPEDEGVMISFGETFDGGGSQPIPTPKAAAETPKVTTPKPTTPKVVKNDYVTQKDNSVAIEEQKKKDKKEKEALEKQRLEEQRIAAEKKRKEQEAIDKANMDGVFGNGGTTGSDNTTGNTPRENPAGKGTSGGNSWSLNGRDLLSTISKPDYPENIEGQITIEIRVDSKGNVIGKPKQIRKTTILDRNMIDAAIKSASLVKFSEGKNEVIGQIIFYYKLH